MVEQYGGEKDLKISRTHRRGFKVDFHIVNLRGDVLRESVCSRGVSSTITVRDFELDAHLPVGARGMARAHHRSGETPRYFQSSPRMSISVQQVMQCVL